jgi:hypothetical protein
MMDVSQSTERQGAAPSSGRRAVGNIIENPAVADLKANTFVYVGFALFTPRSSA